MILNTNYINKILIYQDLYYIYLKRQDLKGFLFVGKGFIVGFIGKEFVGKGLKLVFKGITSFIGKLPIFCKELIFIFALIRITAKFLERYTIF